MISNQFPWVHLNYLSHVFRNSYISIGGSFRINCDDALCSTIYQQAEIPFHDISIRMGCSYSETRRYDSSLLILLFFIRLYFFYYIFHDKQISKNEQIFFFTRKQPINKLAQTVLEKGEEFCYMLLPPVTSSSGSWSMWEWCRQSRQRRRP